MATYQITHGNNPSDTPGTITFEAESDAKAIEKLHSLVADGQRNDAWANMELVDGRLYGASNRHGKVVGGYV